MVKPHDGAGEGRSTHLVLDVAPHPNPLPASGERERTEFAGANSNLKESITCWKVSSSPPSPSLFITGSCFRACARSLGGTASPPSSAPSSTARARAFCGNSKTIAVAYAAELLGVLDEAKVLDWSQLLGAESAGRVMVIMGALMIVLRLVTRTAVSFTAQQ